MSTGLSPNDIRSYEFPNQMRGYDKDEVREFLQQVAVALEDLKQENLKLSMERDSVRTQLEALKQFEDVIKSAAIDARRNADSLVANARQEVNEILTRARAEAEKVVGSRADEAKLLDEQVTRLRMIKASYQAKLKNLIESHLELIDEIQRLKEPDIPRVQPQSAAAEASTDDTAPNPVVTDVVPSTPAASTGQSSDSPSFDFELESTVPTAPPEADWIRQAREANIPAAQQGLKPVKPANGLEVEEVTEVTRKKLETFSSEPEPGEPQHTEEANAAEQIVAVGPAQASTPTPKPPIDPELAAALESYQMKNAMTPNLTRQAAPPLTSAERDTSMRATLNDFDDRAKTGQVPVVVTTDEPDNSTEHNLIDIDQPIGESKPAPRAASTPPLRRTATGNDVGPDDIARELDEVAARFEEEMDKAARS